MQKKNKALNPEQIPELKKLRDTKAEIMKKSKQGRRSDIQTPEWVKYTDKAFQEKYETDGKKTLEMQDKMLFDEVASSDRIKPNELERAMEILVEGYKKVKAGSKEVKLSEILEATKHEQHTWKRKKRDALDEEIYSGNREEFFSRGETDLPSHAEMLEEYESGVPADKPTASDEANMEEGDALVGKEIEEDLDEDEVSRAPLTRKREEIQQEQDEMRGELSNYLNDISCRYLPGFRHYENYEVYSRKFPEKSVQDYIDDMNREATFEEYAEICKTSMRFYSRINPELRMEILEKTEGEPHKLEWVFNSDKFENKLKNDYENRLREMLEHKQVYKLVDCLEEFSDWVYPGDVFRKRSTGVHVPNEHNMVPFYKFVKQIDRPQPLNSHRMGPHDFLNPIKTTPGLAPQKSKPFRRTEKQYNKKYRNMHGSPLKRPRLFSTMIHRTAHMMSHPIAYLPFVVKK